MNQIQPSAEFAQKLGKVTEKVISNNIIFSEIRDERVHTACQEILGVFEANYNSVKGIEEIIRDPNSTDLQKSIARENLEILSRAVFKAVNLFFRGYKQDLITSILDSESIEEFLPEELGGLGVYLVKIQSQIKENEKEFLMEERERISDEKERVDQERLKKLLE